MVSGDKLINQLNSQIKRGDGASGKHADLRRSQNSLGGASDISANYLRTGIQESSFQNQKATNSVSQSATFSSASVKAGTPNMDQLSVVTPVSQAPTASGKTQTQNT